MSERVNPKCLEILKAPETFTFIRKAGHYSALREYQDLYKNGDENTILFLKITKTLQNRRALHLNNLFDSKLDDDKKEFSRGYLNGMSALLINGLKYEYGANAADSIYRGCVNNLKNGSLKIEDIKK